MVDPELEYIYLYLSVAMKKFIFFQRHFLRQPTGIRNFCRHKINANGKRNFFNTIRKQ